MLFTPKPHAFDAAQVERGRISSQDLSLSKEIFPSLANNVDDKGQGVNVMFILKYQGSFWGEELNKWYGPCASKHLDSLFKKQVSSVSALQ